MTNASPTDITNQASTNELLARIAMLEQQQADYHQRLCEQEQHYQQQLHAQKQQYEHQINEYKDQVEQLIEKQKLLIHQLYGQKSEGLTPKQDHLNQESALEDLSALEQIRDNFIAELNKDKQVKPATVEGTDTEILINQSQLETDNDSSDNAQTNPPKTKRHRRIVIPDNLEIRTIVHEPTQTICACGCQLKQIGEDVQDKLGFIPKQFYRERHIYPKYTCKQCRDQALIQSKVPAQIIDKSIATPDLLTHIIISKFADHQPLYRQSLIYERSGVYLSDSTMADWVGRCGVALEPLVKRLHKLLLTQPILHADETPVNILKLGGTKDNGKLRQGYVWAYLTPQHHPFRAVVYDFAESRRNEHPKAFLGNWQGKLICDDYNGYKFLFSPSKQQAVIEVGCIAHARRKFHELHVTGQSIVSEQALDLFQKLYAVERQIDEQFEKNATPMPRVAEQVLQIRQQQAKPIADTLHQWLVEKRQGANKNSAIARAIDYCLKRWKALTQYLDDGNLPIDNNWAENQMRSWALGRKNWLFAGSLRSGQRAAVIMSLIQSARLNGLNVYAYLSNVLKRLPTHKDKDIDELLPHVWQPAQ